jgi:hypothetical protein
MSRIVCGRFDRTTDADATLEALKREGFARSEVDSFYVAPPGQHGVLLAGGDVYSDAGARKAGRGAVLGALVGAVAGGLIGWVIAATYGDTAILLVALLGAFIGAFTGTMARLRGGRRREATRLHPVEPQGGRMIAVCVDRHGAEGRAIELLKRHGARDVGRAEGTWRDGSWRDFDPRAPLAAA